MENENLFTRTEMLLGAGATDKIKRANIAVFGVGGVGSYAVEALARSGVGALTLVDGDVYTPSNMNRQLFADLTTLGKNKAQVAASAVARINPDCKVTVAIKKY